MLGITIVALLVGVAALIRAVALAEGVEELRTEVEHLALVRDRLVSALSASLKEEGRLREALRDLEEERVIIQ